MRQILMIGAAVAGLNGVALAQSGPYCPKATVAQGNAPGSECEGSGPKPATGEGNAGTTTGTQSRQGQAAPQGGQSNDPGVDSRAGGNQAGGAAK